MRIRKKLASQGNSHQRSRRLTFEPLEMRALLANSADLLALTTAALDEPSPNDAASAMFGTSLVNRAEGESTITTRFRFEITDAGGIPISTTVVGDTLLLNVYIQDTRAQATGIFAAYLDITYDALLVTPQSINFGTTYPILNLVASRPAD